MTSSGPNFGKGWNGVDLTHAFLELLREFPKTPPQRVLDRVHAAAVQIDPSEGQVVLLRKTRELLSQGV